MKNTIKIRKAVLRDAATIAAYNTKMAMETEKKELDADTISRGVKAIIKDPHKGFYLVAEKGGEIVGQTMVTYEWSDWRNKNFMWIQSVYIPENCRRQGIFSSLFLYLKQLAASKKNIAGIRLYVEKNNENAKETYRCLGMYDPGYDMLETEI
ncbi:MAG: GNAT family N-acetyltransferase [bacterium]|nr:GNAT family N-acetyltransferase [bacterium]